MKRLVSKSCVWLAVGGLCAGVCTSAPKAYAAQQGTQSMFKAAPAGVQLQVAETAVDLSHPSGLSLHLQLVNGSQQPVKVWPGMHALVTSASDGQGTRCENPPNTSERMIATAKTIRPGESYSEAVALDADVCNGLRQARSVQVELTFFVGDGYESRVESQPIPVQNPPNAADGVRALLTQQAADWNRGDIGAFASGYKNSPDILFIGRRISRGYDQMLAIYQQGYATREAMGTLTFTQLEVQPLDAQFATATGSYHLERTQAGGGNADGYFLLVLEKTASGWKIVRDDTTSLPPATKP